MPAPSGQALGAGRVSPPHVGPSIGRPPHRPRSPWPPHARPRCRPPARRTRRSPSGSHASQRAWARGGGFLRCCEWCSCRYDSTPPTRLQVGGGSLLNFFGRLVFARNPIPVVAAPLAYRVSDLLSVLRHPHPCLHDPGVGSEQHPPLIAVPPQALRAFGLDQPFQFVVLALRFVPPLVEELEGDVALSLLIDAFGDRHGWCLCP